MLLQLIHVKKASFSTNNEKRNNRLGIRHEIIKIFLMQVILSYNE